MPFHRLISVINAHSADIARVAIDAVCYLLTFIGGSAVVRSCLASIGG